MAEELFIVRLWDMFDGWMDITKPVNRNEADRIWNEKTRNGTEMTSYDDGDYYAVFPADTKMLFTPEGKTVKYLPSHRVTDLF